MLEGTDTETMGDVGVMSGAPCESVVDEDVSEGDGGPPCVRCAKSKSKSWCVGRQVFASFEWVLKPSKARRTR